MEAMRSGICMSLFQGPGHPRVEQESELPPGDQQSADEASRRYD